jgi:hypothetical protein
MGNAEFDRWREQFEALLNKDRSYRAMKPVDMSWLVGRLRVDPVTGIAPGIDVVTAEGVRPMVWLPKWRYIVARFDGPGHSRGIDFDPAEWAVIRPGHYVGPPIVDGYLVTSPAVFGADVPAPPGRVDAPGTDGIGPALDGEDGPTRWMLLDGYAYHITNADTGSFHIREIHPETRIGDDLNPDAAR